MAIEPVGMAAAMFSAPVMATTEEPVTTMTLALVVALAVDVKAVTAVEPLMMTLPPARRAAPTIEKMAP